MQMSFLTGCRWLGAIINEIGSGRLTASSLEAGGYGSDICPDILSSAKLLDDLHRQVEDMVKAGSLDLELFKQRMTRAASILEGYRKNVKIGKSILAAVTPKMPKAGRKGKV